MTKDSFQYNYTNKHEQAGSELCQAREKLGRGGGLLD